MNPPISRTAQRALDLIDIKRTGRPREGTPKHQSARAAALVKTGLVERSGKVSCIITRRPIAAYALTNAGQKALMK